MNQSFRNYWRVLSPEQKKELAIKLHTSTGYLSQVAHGHRNPSKKMVALSHLVIGIKLEF